MVYAANCCRLNYENVTIIIFIVLAQCGLLRLVICTPLNGRSYDPSEREKTAFIVNTLTKQNNSKIYRYNQSIANDDLSQLNTTGEFDAGGGFTQPASVNIRPNKSSNGSRTYKNGAIYFIKRKNKTISNSENTNDSIIVDLEVNTKEFLQQILNYHPASFKSINKHESNKSNKSVVGPLQENVNRIIQNDLVNYLRQYIDTDTMFDDPKFDRPQSNDINDNSVNSPRFENLDDFDMISNSIENDDFYFTYTTTAESIPSPTDSIETPPTTTIEPSTEAMATTAHIIDDPIYSLNSSIPFNIPFQFNQYNDSAPVVYENVTETAPLDESTTTIDEIEASATTSELVDSGEILENSTIILDGYNTSAQMPIEQPQTDSTDSQTTSNMTQEATISPETTLETTSEPIESQPTNTISDEINVLTNQPSIETNTTKSIPYPDNPIFLDCIRSCGTDHDCVRTKCLLDSTYFG